MRRVVTLYLLPALNEKLAPRLRAELKPGSRIVSHSFPMGSWTPDKTVEVDSRSAASVDRAEALSPRRTPVSRQRGRHAKSLFVVAVIALDVAIPSAGTQAQQAAPTRTPDVIWVPTHDPVVSAMLKMANVTKNDVVYDLGCGDGKIVIAAAKLGARGVGVDIDPAARQGSDRHRRKPPASPTGCRSSTATSSIRQSRSAKPASSRCTCCQSLNIKLLPRLKAELKPGTRIVSNTFSMGDEWPPEKTEQVGMYPIYFWTIPKR